MEIRTCEVRNRECRTLGQSSVSSGTIGIVSGFTVAMGLSAALATAIGTIGLKD
jgi:hypothetical protein